MSELKASADQLIKAMQLVEQFRATPDCWELYGKDQRACLFTFKQWLFELLQKTESSTTQELEGREDVAEAPSYPAHLALEAKAET